MEHEKVGEEAYWEKPPHQGQLKPNLNCKCEQCRPHKDEVEGWESEFDLEFTQDWNGFDHEIQKEVKPDHIKSFIKTLLAHREESLINEIKKTVNHARILPPSSREIVLDYIYARLEALLSDK